MIGSTFSPGESTGSVTFKFRDGRTFVWKRKGSESRGGGIPPGCTRLLQSCPSEGNGVNDHIYRTALSLHSYVDWQTAFELLVDMSVRAGNKTGWATGKEVERQLNRAWSKSESGFVAPPPEIPVTEPILDLVDSLGRKFDNAFATLQELSPVPADDLQPVDGRVTNRVLRTLFPGNPWMCFGRGEKEHDCKPLYHWINGDRPCEWEFIVPVEQLGRTGLDQTGEYETTHAKSNCGPRRFVVAEFDFAKFSRDGVTPTVFKPVVDGWEGAGITVKEAQASIILHLMAEWTTPVMVVSSGGKSLHAWFNAPKAGLEAWFKTLQTMGSDPRAFRISQFVRMPDGKRSDGARQVVAYLNPKAITK